jgi:hypothetical protein
MVLKSISWLGDGGHLQVNRIDFGNVSGSSRLNITGSGDGFSWTNVWTTASYTLSATTNGGLLVNKDILREDQPGADFTISTTPTGTLMLVPQENAAPDVTLTATIYTGCTNIPTIPFVRQATLQSTTWEAGKSTTYNFTLDISDDISCWGFAYTGQGRTFVVPRDGTYKLETWGARAGSSQALGGLGAYAAGEIDLKKDQVLYVYVGQLTDIQGSSTYAFNGGGGGYDGSGGGATDIRLSGGNWDDAASLSSRILVAAGGGGSGLDKNGNRKINGGAGGGLTGYDGSNFNPNGAMKPGKGGTQTKGGDRIHANAQPGYFGKGGTTASINSGGGGRRRLVVHLRYAGMRGHRPYLYLRPAHAGHRHKDHTELQQ